MPKNLGPWLIAAALAAAVLFAWFSGPATPPPLGRGSTAPGFELPRIGDGRPVALSDLRGKVVLVNFWATWCKPCEDEMPAMERMYRALREQGFELLAISVDEDREVVEAFRGRFGLSFPILMDSRRKVATAYQTFRFPESFLIGRDGVVVERYVGPKEWDAEAYLARVGRLIARPDGGGRG